MLDIKKLYTESDLTKNELIIKASPLLNNIVSHYSLSLINVSDSKEKLSIIPDASGCMVFTFYEHTLDSKVWGATSHIVKVNRSEESAGLLLKIEFMQGGLKYFSYDYQSDLKDRILSLEIVNKYLHESIYQIYESSNDIISFIKLLDNLLIRQGINHKKNEAFNSSIQIVKKLDANISVKELSNMINYSERQLSRIYKEHLGMSAKTYIQMVKINKLLKQMQSSDDTMHLLAHKHNFHDQAHFINVFKNICGVSPKIYKENMSDFYNEDLKF